MLMYTGCPKVWPYSCASAPHCSSSSQISALVGPLANFVNFDLIVCIAGNVSGRRPEALHEFLFTAYIEAGNRNPPLQPLDEHYYVVVQEEGKEKERWLSNTMEHHKFYWKCSCRHEHFRWCTPKAMNEARMLLCLYCHYNNAAWRRARLFTMMKCEMLFVQLVRNMGIEAEVTWQVQLEGWQGCFDFVHLPTMTLFQLDGSTHFIDNNRSTAQHRLQTDIDCCKKAWQHGYRLVRVHHKCSNMRQVVEAAIAMPGSTFVLLTAEFRTVQVCKNGLNLSYVDSLSQVLATAQCQDQPDIACILFKQ